MRKKQGSTAGTEQLQMLVNEAVKSAIDAPAQTLLDKPSGCLPTVIEPVEVERAANRPPFGAWLVNQHQNKREWIAGLPDCSGVRPEAEGQ